MLEVPPPVFECIEVGYELPLLSLLEPYQKLNHKTALINHHNFVSQTIPDLEYNHCTHKSETVSVVCSLLSTVVSSTSKKQLVIDLRYVFEWIFSERQF